MIAIIDYGMGNLASVGNALEKLHFESRITSDPSEVYAADGVILPGVGAISQAMNQLKSRKLDEAVINTAKEGKPLLGICLGMQMFMDESDEGSLENGAPVKGLGLIHGRVERFPTALTSDKGLKVPQIGWNRLENVTGSILKEGDYVYFVHSYYCSPVDEHDTAAFCDYGIRYSAALEHDNIFAVQFHPEKSGEAGLNILSRFARRTK